MRRRWIAFKQHETCLFFLSFYYADHFSILFAFKPTKSMFYIIIFSDLARPHSIIQLPGYMSDLAILDKESHLFEIDLKGVICFMGVSQCSEGFQERFQGRASCHRSRPIISPEMIRPPPTRIIICCPGYTVIVLIFPARNLKFSGFQARKKRWQTTPAIVTHTRFFLPILAMPRTWLLRSPLNQAEQDSLE